MFESLSNYFAINKGRIEYFDIAKAIGIILVVWLHANGPFTSYIYKFIMPMFFLISGLLYSQRSPIKDYLVRKVHSLYLPFIIWNLFFLVVMAIFKNFSLKTFLKKAILILLTLSKEGTFLGATWFLGALFLIAIVYKILESSFKESNYKDISLLFIFGIIAIIGFKFTFPYTISRTLILSFFYALGAFIKKYRSTISAKIDKIPIHFLPVLGFIIYIVIASFNSISIGHNKYEYPLLFIIGALGISYFVIYLCKLMENSEINIVSSIKNFLIVIGQHSIDILIWHTVFFKLIIILQMILNNVELTFFNIISYHNYFSNTNGWWIVYLLVGVFVPLLWGYILRQGVWGKILNKIHAV